MDLDAEHERTEVWRGRHYIIEKSLEVMRKIKCNYDLCIEGAGPTAIMNVPQIRDSYGDLHARGIKIRLITEVNAQNLSSVKELMHWGELRHLDGVVGSFVVADGTDYAGVADIPDSVLTELVVSNVQSFVKQQQYLFEILWQKARPVEERLSEIEEGRTPEVTEIVSGWENIIKRNIANFQIDHGELVSCSDGSIPPIIVNSPMYEASADFVRKGGKIRLITEINSENLAAIKELLKLQEIRHVPNFRLNFGCSENRFMAPISVYSAKVNPQCIISNSRDLIRQHQYLFETLWSEAIPAETRIRELEIGTEPERTEVWRDPNMILTKALDVLAKLKEKYDFCVDWKGPSIIMGLDYIKNAYLDIVARGGRLRLITEIIPQNLAYCKSISEFIELRHLAGIKGNFGVVDGKLYGGTAATIEGKAPSTYLSSNVREFVDQQENFFIMLWDKSIPAAERFRELELGIVPEKTEIISGRENIVRITLEHAERIRKQIDNCINADSVKSFVVPPMWDVLNSLRQRGIKTRIITEIKKEILAEAKQLAGMCQLRHLDEIHGNFEITDALEYRASPELVAGQPPTTLIRSTESTFVKQQQYFFNTLWEKAVPADQRIRELEEGEIPETIRLIRDAEESIKLAFEVMTSARKEFLVLFANSHTFSLALASGATRVYKQMAEAGVKIRILVPSGMNVEDQIAELTMSAPSVELRTSDENLNTRLTIMISDRKELMSWELKDESSSNPYEAAGLATYSNYESIAGSYAIIFENLWKITEFAQNLRTANAMLAGKERAMQEFINIAAHELRTPIQPILGLSQVLRDLSSDEPRKAELLDAILRNSKRLARLQEDILDVSRIQSNMLKLNLTPQHITPLIEESIALFRSQEGSMGAEKKIEISYNNRQGNNVVVNADKSRISQVMSNLFSNSIKFMREGVIIVGTEVATDGRSVIVSVRDLGAGIDSEIMPRLFTKFATKSKQGTGLGLYICKSIIEAHHGKIWGENNGKDPGATFFFSLPIVSSG